MLLECRRRVTCYCPLFLSVIFYCVVFLLQRPQSRESLLCQLNGFHFTACLVTGLVTYQKNFFFSTCTIALKSVIIENVVSFLLNIGPVPRGPNISHSEISVGIFSNFTLTCLIDWDPDNFYCQENPKWLLPSNGTKYNQSLEDTGSKCKKKLVLSIFNVTKNDEGTYSCYFYCKYGSTGAATRAAIDLRVLFNVRPSTGNVLRKRYGQM